ncbi:MAG: argininosuccinate lyase, partial [Bacteroidales bacterium]|nr:argininosuccinate lyase [Candidatus Equibacterium intestinale]
MQTLWNKGISASDAVENFTVGNDRILDLRLAEYDVMGSKAHIAMLAEVGLLAKDEEEILQKELDNILKTIKEGSFVLEECAEDIHSQVEILLTRKLGDLGKKIHSGRCRNNQVLVDLKLYMRDELLAIRGLVLDLFAKLQDLSEQYKDVILPGY